MRGDYREQPFLQRRSCRALVATEDPHLRRFISEALSRAEYPVDCCGGARQEILESCGAKSPAFLIVDVNPERSTGIEVVRELRARGTSMPVILLTGGPCEEAGELGIESFSKPFTLETLKLAIDRAFTRVSLQQMALETQDGPPQQSD